MTLTSGSTTGQLLDQEARRSALTERNLGLVVEAGAGSGKTAILAGRVALLLADGVAPGSIAAITFTELAAAELATRIGEYVDALAAGTVPVTMTAAFGPGGPTEEQRRNLLTARVNLDELSCSTIHGFARELVRPYPVEADIDPGAAVMDPAEQALLFEQTLDDVAVSGGAGNGMPGSPSYCAGVNSRSVAAGAVGLVDRKDPGSIAAPEEVAPRMPGKPPA